MSDKGVTRLEFCLSFGISLVFIFLVFIVVRRFSFDWPHVDDWQSVDWYRNYVSSGNLNLKDMFGLRNGSHPIGFQVFVSTILFKYFGFSFIPLIYAQLVIMALGATLLGVMVFREISAGFVRVLAPFLVLVVFFHSVQVEHVTWGYEIGWFLINFFLMLNIFLVERYREKSLVLVLFALVLAGFCSAHAAALWVVAALHWTLVVKGRARLLGGSFFLLGFFVYAFVIYAITPIEVGGGRVFRSLEFVQYYISLFGAVYATRDGFALAGVGFGVVLLAGVALWHSFHAFENSRLHRLVIALIVGGGVFLLLFVKGRYQHGLPWAVAKFHFGPMLVPVMLGLLLYSFTLMKQSISCARVRASGLCIVVFLVVGAGYSFINFIEQGGENLRKQGVAMHVMCNPGFSVRLIEESNIAAGYYGYLMSRFDGVKHLCTSNAPDVARPLFSVPVLYQMLSEKRPELREPLIALWEVYATHFDLQRAFPSYRPDLVLNFAIQDAKNGGEYDRAGLGVYRDIFGALSEQDIYSTQLVR